MQNDKNLKLIFLDIDGTLTRPGTNTPPDSAVRAIQAAREKGHRFFVCTGRNWALSQPFLAYGLDGAVSSAGAYVVCDGRVLLDHPMTSARRDRVLTVMHQAGAACMLETRDHAYGETEMLTALDHLGASSETERWKKQAFRPIEEYDGNPVYTIPFVCKDAQKLETARQQLAQEVSFCLYDFFDNGNVNGELFSLGYDKGTGIHCICDALGIPVRNTIGFGDSMNDYAMLQAVGTSVCMENGCDELKAISQLVCPAVEQDGLAAGFEMLHLI